MYALVVGDIGTPELLIIMLVAGMLVAGMLVAGMLVVVLAAAAGDRARNRETPPGPRTDSPD